MASVYKTLSKSMNGGKPETPANGVRKNKQKTLLLPSRGTTFRHRHLIQDIVNLLPTAKKDAKFDSKKKLFLLNELCELSNCNNCLYFEARKNQDLYLWASKVPNGPTVKFHVLNISTMEELNFTGNCLKGSRPILSFDSAFDQEPYLQLIKEIFLHVFGVPPGARKSKPFVDHVMSFMFVDGKIWVRNYEIKETDPSKTKAGEDGDEEVSSKSSKGRNKELDMSLLEIGPRFVMSPIIIQEGSFGGPIIYENKNFVSPNQVRADLRRKKATKHNTRVDQSTDRLAKKGDLGLRTNGGKKAPVDELDSKKLFA
ncbi:Uu.00g063340.m01.CDS01 [Anthostomella pinea]|uniref:Uu.00g063340.m01.CDS01 n=1 Tax=Anthostomella pinea TaxID=933095 RepID=A0AAI8VU47_9PEZI|nr:Uu.00g063340.m01.CDS01 [Anthostomella pinea]